MGDFCVSGFHSRIPIRNREKVIAIICRRNKHKLGNNPTYLESSLIPMHIPVIGYMDEYGGSDDFEYEEDETTRMIEGKLHIKFNDIISIILRDYNKYVSYEEQKDNVKNLFENLTKMCSPFHVVEKYEYTVIYEKYSIYKAMTYEIPKMKKCLELIGAGDSVFDEYTGRPLFINTELNNDEYREYMPYHYCWNQFSQMNGVMDFYDNSIINWKELADSVVNWASFCINLEKQNGMFIPCKYAGQIWHFDKIYVKDQKKILKTMIKEYDKLLLSYEEFEDLNNED